MLIIYLQCLEHVALYLHVTYTKISASGLYYLQSTFLPYRKSRLMISECVHESVCLVLLNQLIDFHET
jgi:hypothetical protein